MPTSSMEPRLFPPGHFERPLWAPENLGLLVQATRCEFVSRDKGSALGIVWHLLNPLLTTAVLYVVFARVMRVEGVAHYPLFMLLGVMQFGFFSQATSRAAQSVTNGRTIVLNSNIRREILVLRAVGVEALNYAIELVILTVLIAFARGGLSFTSGLFPIVVALQMAFTVGVSLALGAAVVYLPDLAYIWGISTRLLFFVTPIFYTLDMIREPWLRTLIGLNPLARFAEVSARLLLVGRLPDAQAWAVAAGGALLAFLLGLNVFRRLTPMIPEHI